MITKENLEHFEKTLAESGLQVSQETLKESFEKYPDGFDMRVTRPGKEGLEDSTLFFRKSDKGIFTHTEIKERNFTFLADQLLDTEMGAEVLIKVRENMIKGMSEFTVPYLKTVKDQATESKLNFSYYPTNGFYYWNSYDFQLLGRAPGERAGIPQRVFIDKSAWANNYTLSEMTVLLTGGTITKELVAKSGDFYVAERKFDFTNVDKHGNFTKVKPESQSVAIGPNQTADSSKQSTSKSKNQTQNPTTRSPRRRSSQRY